LRERLLDLPLLVEHIVRNLGMIDEQTLAVVRSPEFLSALGHHNWPGNIRELRNYLERCVALRDFSAPKLGDAISASPESAVNVGPTAARGARGLGERLREAFISKSYTARARQPGQRGGARGGRRTASTSTRLLWKNGLRTREPSVRDVEDASP